MALPCTAAIPNLVAGAVDAMCGWLGDRPAAQVDAFKVVLQLHDALYFEVPIPAVTWFVDQVIPAMLRAVPIWPRDLDGNWTGTGPYYFGVDTGVYLNWDEPISRARGLELGIPERFCGA